MEKLTDTLLDNTNETLVIKIPRHHSESPVPVRKIKSHSLAAIAVNNATYVALLFDCHQFLLTNIGGNLWMLGREAIPIDYLIDDTKLKTDGVGKEFIFIPRTQELNLIHSYYTEVLFFSPGYVVFKDGKVYQTDKIPSNPQRFLLGEITNPSINIIMGPRGKGKSTLVKRIETTVCNGDGHIYDDIEDPLNVFLNSHRNTLIKGIHIITQQSYSVPIKLSSLRHNIIKDSMYLTPQFWYILKPIIPKDKEILRDCLIKFGYEGNIENDLESLTEKPGDFLVYNVILKQMFKLD